VESALKLVRTISGRHAMINFTNAFHGMTLGALSVTGSSMKRHGAGIPLVHATPMPYDNYFEGTQPDFLWLEKLLQDTGSGLDEPAAVIVETVQGEGGINPARVEWLQGLDALCKEHGILLIVDDVQMGVERTGPFFSSGIAGIEPDIVCLSKSISGYGLPMALTLIKPEHDVWGPGEHNGTFRGHNPAFVTATAALNTSWRDDALERSAIAKGERVEEVLTELAARIPGLTPKGRGLARGLRFRPARAGREGLRRGVRARPAHGDLRAVRRGHEDPAPAHHHRRRAGGGPGGRAGVRRRRHGAGGDGVIEPARAASGTASSSTSSTSPSEEGS
jgi:diaminobutyrate-2-oxoglutarate transaminase